MVVSEKMETQSVVRAFLFAGRSLYEEARAGVDWPDAILETLPFRAARYYHSLLYWEGCAPIESSWL